MILHKRSVIAFSLLVSSGSSSMAGDFWVCTVNQGTIRLIGERAFSVERGVVKPLSDDPRYGNGWQWIVLQNDARRLVAAMGTAVNRSVQADVIVIKKKDGQYARSLTDTRFPSAVRADFGKCVFSSHVPKGWH